MRGVARLRLDLGVDGTTTCSAASPSECTASPPCVPACTAQLRTLTLPGVLTSVWRVVLWSNFRHDAYPGAPACPRLTLPSAAPSPCRPRCAPRATSTPARVSCRTISSTCIGQAGNCELHNPQLLHQSIVKQRRGPPDLPACPCSHKRYLNLGYRCDVQTVATTNERSAREASAM